MAGVEVENNFEDIEFVIPEGFNGVIGVHSRGCSLLKAQGSYTVGGEMVPYTTSSVFDIGGLTELLITKVCMLRLVEAGRLSLKDRVSRYIPEFCIYNKSGVTVADIFLGKVMLVPEGDLYREICEIEKERGRLGFLSSRAARLCVYDKVNKMIISRDGGKRGESRLNAVVLGRIIEVVTGQQLPEAVNLLLVQPLELKSTGYIDLELVNKGSVRVDKTVVCPSGRCKRRGKLVLGEVKDDLAYIMGGISGHSGAFSNLIDILKILRSFFLAYEDKTQFLKASSIDLLLESMDSKENGYEVDVDKRIFKGVEDDRIGIFCNFEKGWGCVCAMVQDAKIQIDSVIAMVMPQ